MFSPFWGPEAVLRSQRAPGHPGFERLPKDASGGAAAGCGGRVGCLGGKEETVVPRDPNTF